MTLLFDDAVRVLGGRVSDLHRAAQYGIVSIIEDEFGTYGAEFLVPVEDARRLYELASALVHE